MCNYLSLFRVNTKGLFIVPLRSFKMEIVSKVKTFNNEVARNLSTSKITQRVVI